MPPELPRCPDCGKPVSPKAFQCPNCGCPFETRERRTEEAPRSGGGGCFGLGCLALLAIVAILGIGLAVSNPNEQAHRAALGAKIPGFNIGAPLGELLKTARYKYNNYIFFSKMSVVGIDGIERTISNGALGQVSVIPADQWK